MRQRKQQALLAAIIFIVVLCARFVPGISSQSATATQPKEPTTVTATPHEAEQLASAVAGAPLLHHTGYVWCYNAETRLPHWVAWVLTANHTTGPYKRNGIKFQEDTDVDAPRATHEDYIRSGYDRGHLCPSGDNKWSEEAQRQSFLMTNICPQNGQLNSNGWSRLEKKVRSWAKRDSALIVITGPIYQSPAPKTIGKEMDIPVPDAFFKVIYAPRQVRAIAFVYPNEGQCNRKLRKYATSVRSVELLTGLNFFAVLDDDLENRIENQNDFSQWEINSK